MSNRNGIRHLEDIMAFETEIKRAAEVIEKAKALVAFSGAGMSAESGVDTFRDPGGLWDRFDPSMFATGEGILRTLTTQPEAVAEIVSSLVDTFRKAQPNPGHCALAELERMGILRSVITQNVDDLHGQAGNKKVVEVHGNLYRWRCLSCGNKFSYEKDTFLDFAERLVAEMVPFDLTTFLSKLPLCECASPARVDVVMFGESVQDLDRAFRDVETCDVMMVLGTSGVVYPAAFFPQRARQSGAAIIEINAHESPFGSISEVSIQEQTGSVLPRILDEVKAMRGG